MRNAAPQNSLSRNDGVVEGKSWVRTVVRLSSANMVTTAGTHGYVRGSMVTRRETA